MSKKQYYLFLDSVIVGIVPSLCLLIIELGSSGERTGPSLIVTLAVVLLPAAAVIRLYYRQISSLNEDSPKSSTEISPAILPAALSDKLTEEYKKSGDLLQEALKHAAEQRGETLQAFRQLSEIVTTLRKVVEEREQELKRYKQNHDAELYRKFLRRVIDICESAQDAVATNPDKPEVAQIKDLAEFLLEECGVKVFEPAVGALYREEFGVADSPRYTPSNDPSKARRIARVIRPGYELLGGSTRQVVMPAKVEVFDDVKTTVPLN